MGQTIEKLNRALPGPVSARVHDARDRVRFLRQQPQERRLRRALIGPGSPVVGYGPFQGMRYLPDSFASAYWPKVVGSYEQELHAAVASYIATPPTKVIDIGAAEGFYAVGFARAYRLAGVDVEVIASDIDEEALSRCRDLAALNEVNLTIRGETTHTVLRDDLREPGALVVCDIEAAELVVLDPVQVPELAGAHILCELHDCLDPRVTPTLTERFDPTHDIEIIWQQDRDPRLYRDLRGLSPEDQAWAVDEWRGGRMSWAVMRPRGQSVASS